LNFKDTFAGMTITGGDCHVSIKKNNLYDVKLAIIGDFKKENATHKATNAAIGHSLEAMNSGMEVHWVATDSILSQFQRITGEYHGFLIAPGSPYASMEGVLEIIRYARENDVPVLGTCGGFQHMVIEFARNVMGISDAAPDLFPCRADPGHKNPG
jgi:CTP synthase (UTP-ammonia lyase)